MEALDTAHNYQHQGLLDCFRNHQHDYRSDNSLHAATHCMEITNELSTKDATLDVVPLRWLVRIPLLLYPTMSLLISGLVSAYLALCASQH